MPTLTDQSQYSEADLIDPHKPHDQFGFEQLAGAYNFRNTSDRRQVFTRLVIDECRQRDRPVVLDIGCGRGIGRLTHLQWLIRQHAGQYWGLEPDPTVTPAEGLFDRYENALMEETQLPANSVDVSFSFMVMEHVAAPAAFLEAVYRCMKPGGVHWFATVNAHHYFTRTASLMNRLSIDELILRIIKGKQKVEAYHYPVCYRCNAPRQIAQLAEQVGFAPPEFAFMEAQGPRGYFPGPLRPMLHLMNLKRRMIRSPRSLLTLICRMQKPADS